MRNIGPGRRGAILLQTLVMCLILAFISISVTRWVLNRYMGATRTARSSQARTASLGGAMYLFSTWNTAVNPTLPGSVDAGGGKTMVPVDYDGGGTKRVRLSYDEEQ